MAPEPAPVRSELRRALHEHRGAFVGVAVFSAVVNILMLTGSLFMLEVYDRVLPSRSVPTLVALCVIALALYALMGVLDAVRGRVLARIGGALAERLCKRAFALVSKPGVRGEPVRDLDAVSGFLASPGPTAFFDLPWLPFYLFICFAFHPWIGWTALGGALLLVALAIATDRATRTPTAEAHAVGLAREALVETARRNAEAVRVLGMGERLTERFVAASLDQARGMRAAGDVSGDLGVASKTLRMALQSLVLAVGAYLVILGEVTPGLIIASSILSARALAPVETAIAHWRRFLGARRAWTRLETMLADDPATGETLPLPAPTRTLAVDGASVVPPGTTAPTLVDVRFALSAGDGLAVVGPSASGKSTLARALVGAWPLAAGDVRLDGATLDQWEPDRLGRHIGYMPQDVALFDGTVAQNIARFDAAAPAEAVVAAARAAGAHEMILRMPRGYDTPIGAFGVAISAGQRQRIGLARALFGDPFLVVLDEPNANLDATGEAALDKAIRNVRARGGIVAVVSHRAPALAGLDTMLVLAQGRVQAFGPKDEVVASVLQRKPARLEVVAGHA